MPVQEQLVNIASFLFSILAWGLGSPSTKQQTQIGKGSKEACATIIRFVSDPLQLLARRVKPKISGNIGNDEIKTHIQNQLS
jgi:hypothetical protein